MLASKRLAYLNPKAHEIKCLNLTFFWMLLVWIDSSLWAF